MMQTYRVTLSTGEEGSRGRRLFSSYLQTPTKFIGELHVILSIALIVAFSVVISIYATLAEPETQEMTHYRSGVIAFMTVCIVGSCLDLGLAIFLVHSAKQMSVTKCLFWWRCTFVSTVVSCMLSLCFAILVGSVLILLAILPNTAFKPFGLYVAGGFLGDIARNKAKVSATRLHLESDQDNLDEDCVDYRTQSKRPPTASSSSSNQSTTRARSVLVYPDIVDGDVASSGDTVPLTTANVVEEILQEKFHFLSNPASSSHTAAARTKSNRKKFFEDDQNQN